MKVVCYLREPLDYLNSSLQQFIKPGLTDINHLLDNSFPNYSLQGCPNFSGGAQDILDAIYFSIPKKFLRVFGESNVSFVRFEHAAKEGLSKTLLGYVMPQYDFSWLVEKRFNDALSHEACLLIAAYNVRQPLLFPSGMRLNRKRNRDKKIVPVLRKVGGRKPILINPDFIDIESINHSIIDITNLLGYQVFTLIDDVPEKFRNVPLLSFSEQSIIEITDLLDGNNAFMSKRGDSVSRELIDSVITEFERNYGSVKGVMRRLFCR